MILHPVLSENQKTQIPFYIFLIATPLSTSLMEVAKLFIIIFLFYFLWQKRERIFLKNNFFKLPYQCYLLIAFLILHSLAIVFSSQWLKEERSLGTWWHLTRVFFPQMVVFLYTYLFFNLQTLKKMTFFFFLSILTSSVFGIISVLYFQGKYTLGFYGHRVTYGQILSLFWCIALVGFCFNLEKLIVIKRKKYFYTTIALFFTLILLLIDISKNVSRSVSITIMASLFLIFFYYFSDKKKIFLIFVPFLFFFVIWLIPENIKARTLQYLKIFKRETSLVSLNHLSILHRDNNVYRYKGEILLSPENSEYPSKQLWIYTEKRKRKIKLYFFKNKVTFDIPKSSFFQDKINRNKHTVTLVLRFRDKNNREERIYFNAILDNTKTDNPLISYDIFYHTAYQPLLIKDIGNYLSEFWKLRVNPFYFTRELLWKSSVNMASKKKILGYGPKTWRKFANDINHNDFAYVYLHHRDNDHFYSHSNILDIAYRSGVLSAIIFFLFVWGLLFTITFKIFALKKKCIFKDSPYQNHYRLFVILVFCFWSINLSGIFDSTLFSVGVTIGTMYWFLLGILMQFLYVEKKLQLDYFK